MVRLGVYSHNLLGKTNEFFKSIGSYVILIHLLLAMISSSAFIYKNPTDFQAALDSFVIIIAVCQAFGAFLNIGLKMMNIKALHLKLQEIVDEGLFYPKFRYNFSFKLV